MRLGKAQSYKLPPAKGGYIPAAQLIAKQLAYYTLSKIISKILFKKKIQNKNLLKITYFQFYKSHTKNTHFTTAFFILSIYLMIYAFPFIHFYHTSSIYFNPEANFIKNNFSVIL